MTFATTCPPVEECKLVTTLRLVDREISTSVLGTSLKSTLAFFGLLIIWRMSMLEATSTRVVRLVLEEDQWMWGRPIRRPWTECVREALAVNETNIFHYKYNKRVVLILLFSIFIINQTETLILLTSGPLIAYLHTDSSATYRVQLR